MQYIKFADLADELCTLQSFYTEPRITSAEALAYSDKYWEEYTQDKFKAIGALEALSKVLSICRELCKTAHSKNPFESLLSTADAAARWDITEDTIRKAIQSGRLERGHDC